MQESSALPSVRQDSQLAERAWPTYSGSHNLTSAVTAMQLNLIHLRAWMSSERGRLPVTALRIGCRSSFS